MMTDGAWKSSGAGHAVRTLSTALVFADDNGNWRIEGMRQQTLASGHAGKVDSRAETLLNAQKAADGVMVTLLMRDIETLKGGTAP